MAVKEKQRQKRVESTDTRTHTARKWEVPEGELKVVNGAKGEAL